VIGADGFGFVMAGDHYEKFPQMGRVVIETTSRWAPIPAWTVQRWG
jgi:UDP-3-O-[3-hydroxymyristoyl] glucosamine N-acyltransferase